MQIIDFKHHMSSFQYKFFFFVYKKIHARIEKKNEKNSHTRVSIKL